MKETETAEDVSQNKSDENITKKKLMKIRRVPIGGNVNKHAKNTFEAELLDAIDMGTKKSTAEIKVDSDEKKPTVKSRHLWSPISESSSTQVHLLYCAPLRACGQDQS